jgi:hypothetical protein
VYDLSHNAGEVLLMDLEAATVAHLKWKIRLLQCIHGQVELPNADEVARDDACELGKWLGSRAKGYASLPSFQDARSAHATFHLRAAEVVVALDRGDKGQAETMLLANSPYVVASDTVVFALTKLRGEARKAGLLSPDR